MALVDTYEPFKYILYIWSLTGVLPPTPSNSPKTKYYILYSIILNVFVSFGPLTLLVNLFYLDSFKILLENLTLNLTVFACSLKVLNVVLKRKKLLQIKNFTRKLDARVKDSNELDYLENAVKRSRYIFYFYSIWYFLVAVCGELSVVFSKERRLLYPSWCPFDWHTSDLYYWIVHVYQLLAISIQIFQNLADDTYPAILLCTLTAHFHVLCMRCKKLEGISNKMKKEEHLKDLVECIQDHLTILDYCDTLQDALSNVMLLQLFVSELVICISAVYAVLVQDDLMAIIFIISYLCAITLQIVVSCYYGNELLYVSGELTTALYSCNWTEQTPEFKKILIIFMERSKRPNGIFAGNIFPLSLPTFMSVLRSAYSIYAVLIQMK